MWKTEHEPSVVGYDDRSQPYHRLPTQAHIKTRDSLHTARGQN